MTVDHVLTRCPKLATLTEPRSRSNLEQLHQTTIIRQDCPSENEEEEVIGAKWE
jgi:hypothetical protein